MTMKSRLLYRGWFSLFAVFAWSGLAKPATVTANDLHIADETLVAWAAPAGRAAFAKPFVPAR